MFGKGKDVDDSVEELNVKLHKAKKKFEEAEQKALQHASRSGKGATSSNQPEGMDLQVEISHITAKLNKAKVSALQSMLETQWLRLIFVAHSSGSQTLHRRRSYQ